jgi:hypothetical protein
VWTSRPFLDECVLQYFWSSSKTSREPMCDWQLENHFKNQYLPHSESKYYQINFIKSSSSRSFQRYQRHIPFAPNSSATI